MAFPTIENPTGIKEKSIKMGAAHISEAGYPMGYARATAAKKEFTVSWSAMSTADKNTLQTHFNTNKGASFTWTHPETSTEYDVLYMDDEIEFTWVSNLISRWAVSIVLREA